MIRGPYCTGAVTPSGACAFVSQPQPHLQREHLVLGRHRPDRRDVDDLPALDPRSPARPSGTSRSSRHCAGRCRTFLSGWSVSSIVAPGWPFGRPASARTCRAATSAPASPARPTTAASRNSASSSSPGRPGPRPATAARPACSRSTAISAACSAIRASRSASSSRSRVFAARSPRITAVGNAGHLGHAPHYYHDSAQPANRQASKPLAASENTAVQKERPTDLSSYLRSTLTIGAPSCVSSKAGSRPSGEFTSFRKRVVPRDCPAWRSP